MLEQTVILCIIVFTAFAVEASLGFGATVITVAIGSFLLPIPELLPAFIPANVALSAYLVARHPRDVDARLLLTKIVPFMALGIPVGLLLFQTAGNHLLQLLFGAFVVVLSAIELWKVLRPRTQAPRPLGRLPSTVLLLLGGAIHGVFATGGPMAVYVVGRIVGDKGGFRGTLSALWLILNGVLIGGYLITGTLTVKALGLSAILLIPVVLGIVVGEWVHRRVSLRVFTGLVFGLLLVAGGVLCATSHPATPPPAATAPKS